MENEPISLYIHIPFCRHRCGYCDFNTYTTLGDIQREYVHALCREIRQVAGSIRRIARTIFIGGGTPTILPSKSLGLILETVRGCFDVPVEAEITVEANPETINLEYLVSLRQLGVNRLSIGAQSAVKTELILLERKHDFESVIKGVAMSRSAGFDNLNLDLIYGLPGQTVKDWEISLEATQALKPEHLSLYCLTLERGTPMYRRVHRGKIAPPNPDIAADQYEFTCEWMASHGYDHYEISNWALPSFQCRHNLTYWRNEDYLGFGAGAHGHANGYRYATVKQPRVFIKRVLGDLKAQYPWSSTVASHHKLSRLEAMSDTVITQLRLINEGINLAAFSEKFEVSFEDAYPGVVEPLIELGLIYRQSGRLRLTSRGLLLSNQVFYRFL